MTILDVTNRSGVIARSIAMHPTLYADACDAVARIHRQFVQVAHDGVAVRVAEGMATQLAYFNRACEAGALRDGTAVVPDRDTNFSLHIMAYDIARRLQAGMPAGQPIVWSN
jgi:hypothetical protein